MIQIYIFKNQYYGARYRTTKQRCAAGPCTHALSTTVVGRSTPEYCQAGHETSALWQYTHSWKLIVQHQVWRTWYHAMERSTSRRLQEASRHHGWRYQVPGITVSSDSPMLQYSDTGVVIYCVIRVGMITFRHHSTMVGFFSKRFYC